MLPSASMTCGRTVAQRRACVERDAGLGDLRLRRRPARPASLPNAERAVERATIRASARSPAPRARITWWMRPGPEAGLRGGEAAALLAEDVRDRHPHVVEDDLAVAVLVLVTEDRQRPDDLDAGGVGRHDDHRLLAVGRRASGSVLPMTTKTLQRGSAAPVIHHLRPLMTYSSPSRTMRVSMFVASEVATAGSVIAKAERISPSSSGSSHCFCCSSVPSRWSSSMLPVSGAAQLVASGASSRLQPVSSASGGVLQLGQPGLGRQEEVPQPLLLGRGLELLDHRRDRVVVVVALGAVGTVGRPRRGSRGPG